jgi:hypothetical protein
MRRRSANAARGDATPSNKPLEWTGHHEQPGTPPQVPCLPLRGSVGGTVACLLDFTPIIGL